MGSQLKGALLALALGTLYLAALDRPELIDPDESRHAVIAREMLDARRFLTPRVYDEPYRDKPVGFHWTVAASLAALGSETAAARLPAALSALATLAIAAWWAKRLRGGAAARFAALALGTSGLFLAVGRLATVDMLFTALLTAAIAWLSVGADEPLASRRSVIPFYALTALACLVKGPVAIALVIPAALVARSTLLSSGSTAWLRPLAGTATVSSIAAPWYFAAWLADPEYVRSFLGLHNVGRFLGTDLLAHQRSLAYYALTLPAALLPWTPLVAIGCATHWKRRAEHTAGERVVWAWVAAVTLLFGAASTRLITYLLPAFPALFVVAGCGLLPAARPSAGERAPSWLGVYACAWLALVAIAASTAATVAYVSLRGLPGVAWRAVTTGALALVSVAFVSQCVVRRRAPSTELALAASAVVAMVGAYGPVADLLTEAKGYRSLAQELSIAIPPNGVVSSLSRAPHALSFYLGRPIGRVRDIEGARSLLAGEHPVYLLTKSRHAGVLLDEGGSGVEAWWRNAQGTMLVVNRAASAARSAPEQASIDPSRRPSAIEKSAVVPSLSLRSSSRRKDLVRPFPR